MEIGAYLYPWDVLGDADAPGRLADLGLSHVTLAAYYHATRALTPHHPAHRVVVAPHSAAYYPTSDTTWYGQSLRPPPATWTGSPDPFGETVDALAAVGLPVHAWVVLNHLDPAGPEDAGANAGSSVFNAYGDRYPWALCPARPEVRRFAVDLAAEVAGRPAVSGIELESTGWYGFDHLSAHDKTAGVPLSPAQQYLFSLCFCDGCRDGYRAVGVPAAELAATVRTALDATAFQGSSTVDSTGEDAQIVELLGPHLAAAVGRMRQGVADDYRAEIVAAVRAAGPHLTVGLHATPQPHRSGAFTGVRPVTAAALVDRVVVNCWEGTGAVGASGAGDDAVPVAASLLAVGGMGGRPADLGAQAKAARTAGARGIRLYHAGLASPADLAGVRTLTDQEG